MILPFVPIEYQVINWCRDCQLHRHADCMDVTCHCESPSHGKFFTEEMLARNVPVPGDAFNRASGGG